jgi:hypothetical protein
VGGGGGKDAASSVAFTRKQTRMFANRLTTSGMADAETRNTSRRTDDS